MVDDDENIRTTVTAILEDEGYPVAQAANGAEGLAQIAALDPALVLLDMRMPGMNGWDVAARLRQEGHQVPIVVMTAAQDARRWAAEIGAAGYVAKPFQLMELLDTVARVLEPSPQA